jgi:hypothetical protein
MQSENAPFRFKNALSILKMPHSDLKMPYAIYTLAIFNSHKASKVSHKPF